MSSTRTNKSSQQEASLLRDLRRLQNERRPNKKSRGSSEPCMGKKRGAHKNTTTRFRRAKLTNSTPNVDRVQSGFNEQDVNNFGMRLRNWRENTQEAKTSVPTHDEAVQNAVAIAKRILGENVIASKTFSLKDIFTQWRGNALRQSYPFLTKVFSDTEINDQGWTPEQLVHVKGFAARINWDLPRNHQLKKIFLRNLALKQSQLQAKKLQMIIVWDADDRDKGSFVELIEEFVKTSRSECFQTVGLLAGCSGPSRAWHFSKSWKNSGLEIMLCVCPKMSWKDLGVHLLSTTGSLLVMNAGGGEVVNNERSRCTNQNVVWEAYHFTRDHKEYIENHPDGGVVRPEIQDEMSLVHEPDTPTLVHYKDTFDVVSTSHQEIGAKDDVTQEDVFVEFGNGRGKILNDGHGGSNQISKLIAQRLVEKLEQPLTEAEQQGTIDNSFVTLIDNAMDEIHSEVSAMTGHAGSTAHLMWIGNNAIYNYHLGDCRSLAARNGSIITAKQTVIDLFDGDKKEFCDRCVTNIHAFSGRKDSPMMLSLDGTHPFSGEQLCVGHITSHLQAAAAIGTGSIVASEIGKTTPNWASPRDKYRQHRSLLNQRPLMVCDEDMDRCFFPNDTINRIEQREWKNFNKARVQQDQQDIQKAWDKYADLENLLQDVQSAQPLAQPDGDVESDIELVQQANKIQQEMKVLCQMAQVFHPPNVTAQPHVVPEQRQWPVQFLNWENNSWRLPCGLQPSRTLEQKEYLGKVNPKGVVTIWHIPSDERDGMILWGSTDGVEDGSVLDVDEIATLLDKSAVDHISSISEKRQRIPIDLDNPMLLPSQPDPMPNDLVQKYRWLESLAEHPLWTCRIKFPDNPWKNAAKKSFGILADILDQDLYSHNQESFDRLVKMIVNLAIAKGGADNTSAYAVLFRGD